MPQAPIPILMVSGVRLSTGSAATEPNIDASEVAEDSGGAAVGSFHSTEATIIMSMNPGVRPYNGGIEFRPAACIIVVSGGSR